MKDEEIYKIRKERLLKAAEEFSTKLENLPDVLEIVLFGSLASSDPYPNDIDLSIFLSGLTDIHKIAKSARQISSISHSWEVFVFLKDLNFIGRICEWKDCPHQSIECNYPSCGKTKHIKITPGFKFKPEVFLSSPYRILFTRSERSIFEKWREVLDIKESRSYEELKPIPKICIECGRRFIFTIAEQKIYSKRGLYPPKRCERCRLLKMR